ncbi:MAG TPA: helix-turn-helix transcriptional regulator [Gemmatimonadaceae bacterium]|nr:helix-turn-helix transcriptional regulator [Gemmatimonadaceae bacterium]
MNSRRSKLAPFSHVVREFRKATGFKQERFAYEAGLDRAGYGRLERGESNVTFLSLRRLLIGLGVTWRDFGAALHEFDALPEIARRAGAPRRGGADV